MIKIISANVNGLKSYYEKGAYDNLVGTFSPDILCLQETKCSESKVGYWISDYNYEYIPYASSNHWKKGYAGVATIIKEDILKKVRAVSTPHLYHNYGEGRIVTVEFDDFTLVNVYTLNSGDKDEERSDWDKLFLDYINNLTHQGQVIIVGDMNVVPSYLDYWGNYYDVIDSMPGLKDFENKNYKKLLSECHLTDSFRQLHPETRAYSWYSYSGGAREQNHGWRLDLALVSDGYMTNVKYSEVHSKFEGSDHSPIELVLNN